MLNFKLTKVFLFRMVLIHVILKAGRRRTLSRQRLSELTWELVAVMLLTDSPAFPSWAFVAAVNRAEVDTALLHPVSLGIDVALDLADRSVYPASEPEVRGVGYIRGHLLNTWLDAPGVLTPACSRMLPLTSLLRQPIH